MRNLHSFGLRGTGSVITSVASRSALVLLASLAVACGSADEKEKQAWACRGANVPLGESVECTSTIAQKLLEGVTSSDGVSGVSYDGSGTDAIIRWDCSSTATSILCPNSGYAVGGYSTDVGGASASGSTGTGGTGTGGLPTSGGVSSDTSGTGGTGTGGTTGTGTGGTGTGGLPTSGGVSGDGTGTGGTGTGGTGTGTGTGTGGTGTGGLPGAGSASGDGSGTGGTGTGATGSGSGTNTGTGTGGTGTGGNPGAGSASGDGGGTTGSGLAPECAYGPDLSYCGPPTSTDGTGTGATGGSTGGTTGTDTNGNGNGNGGTGNGNGNGNGSTGGTDGTGTGGNPSAGGTSTDGSGGTTGSGGSGNGNGNGGAGNGNGNGNKTPTTTDGNGGKPTGGKAGGGFTCVTQHGETTCITKKPSCVQGAKPSACGACVPAGSNEGDCQPPSQGGCWITGGGFIPVATGGNGKATFGGNGKPMKDGRIQGEWNHVDHGTGGHVHGQVRYLVCRHVDEPGPGMPGGNKNFIDNQAYFGGPARYAPTGGTMAEGYWFDVFVEDHGEPGNKPGPGNHGSKGPDEYQLVLRKQADPAKQQSGTIVYQAPLGDLGGGNIQLHPPNGGHPATASSLPQWVSYQE